MHRRIGEAVDVVRTSEYSDGRVEHRGKCHDNVARWLKEHVLDRPTRGWWLAVECQSWWNDNALYLEPEARSAFNHAYFPALDHRVLLEGGRVTGGGLESIEEDMRVVLGLGDVIMQAVALPSLTAHEAKEVVPRES